jgi:alpha/beta superfamily hydrolase
MAAVGYSFGAGVLLGGVRKVKASKAFVFIAPPLSAVRDSALSKDKRPKLFIAGQRDGVVPSVDLQRALDDVRQPVEFHEVPEANHGLAGHEIEVAERVADFLAAELDPDVPDTSIRY